MNEASAIIAELLVRHVGFWLASVPIVTIFYPDPEHPDRAVPAFLLGSIGVFATILNACTSGYPYNIFDILVLLIDSALALWIRSVWVRAQSIAREREAEQEHERVQK